MDGGTLADVIKAVGPIPESVLVQISHKLLTGLYYIHKQLHIIHRDIKPLNILINTKGEIKITDFGVSGKIENTIGKAISFVGTVTYMSPERIKGTQHSANSDIWSLGLTILECALGYYPYTPPSSDGGLTFFQLLEYIVQQPVPLPEADKFSADFCKFISTCLQKDPETRPDSSRLLTHHWIESRNASCMDAATWLSSAIETKIRIKKKS